MRRYQWRASAWWRWLRLVALGTALIGGPAIASQDAKTKSITVNLAGVSFSPKSTKAKVGDKIKFVWKNGTHNAYRRLRPRV